MKRLHSEITEIPCPLRTWAEKAPDRPVILTANETVRYGELDRRVSAAAASLRRRGIGPGDRVAMLLPTGVDYLTIMLALFRLGAVACPLSTRLPERGVREKLRILDARTLITTEPFGMPGVTVLSPSEGLTGEAPPAPRSVRCKLRRPATIVFTSGSSGTPKAAVHTLGNHYFSAAGSNRNIALPPGSRWLLSLPLYHVGGLAILFRCLLAGVALALPGRAPMGEALRRFGVTHVSMVSTQLRRLLRDGCEGLDRLRAVLLGGSAMPPGLIEAAHAKGLPLHTSYGLTEMASQVTTTPPGAPLEKLLTSGCALPFRELRLAAGGEVLVRGKTLFLGYVTDGDVRLPLDDEGWFHTGDLGELDEGGYVRILGRKDHMFISGGENIHPEAIERALCRIGGVTRAVVTPLPDEEFGARPVAFVEVEAGGPAIEELQARLSEELPRFMLPVRYLPWPEGGGQKGLKVDRAFFRALALRETEEDQEGRNRRD